MYDLLSVKSWHCACLVEQRMVRNLRTKQKRCEFVVSIQLAQCFTNGTASLPPGIKGLDLGAHRYEPVLQDSLDLLLFNNREILELLRRDRFTRDFLRCFSCFLTLFIQTLVVKNPLTEKASGNQKYCKTSHEPPLFQH